MGGGTAATKEVLPCSLTGQRLLSLRSSGEMDGISLRRVSGFWFPGCWGGGQVPHVAEDRHVGYRECGKGEGEMRHIVSAPKGPAFIP